MADGRCTLQKWPPYLLCLLLFAAVWLDTPIIQRCESRFPVLETNWVGSWLWRMWCYVTGRPTSQKVIRLWRGSWDTGTTMPQRSPSSLQKGIEVSAHSPGWAPRQLPAPTCQPPECTILKVARPQSRDSRRHCVEQRRKIIKDFCVKPLSFEVLQHWITRWDSGTWQEAVAIKKIYSIICAVRLCDGEGLWGSC